MVTRVMGSTPIDGRSTPKSKGNTTDKGRADAISRDRGTFPFTNSLEYVDKYIDV